MSYAIHMGKKIKNEGRMKTWVYKLRLNKYSFIVLIKMDILKCGMLSTDVNKV